MMKNSGLQILSLFIFISLLTGLKNPAVEINDLERLRLKGKVRSVMETMYAISEKSEPSGNNEIIYQKLTLFDENGYEKETRLYRNNAEYLISRFVPGKDGKPDEKNEFLPDGTLNLNVTYKYDEKGFRSEAIYNWSENRIIGEICEQYDYYDDILQNEIFNRVEYKSDYRGYFTEEKFITSGGEVSFILASKYDFRGNRLESGYLKGNGMLSWITKYKYDRYDNLIESRVFKSNRAVVESEYKYQFDATGNWLTRKEKREVYVNILTAGINTSDMLTERTIEYY